MHPIHALFEKAVRLYFDTAAAGKTRRVRGTFGMRPLCRRHYGLTTVFGWEGDRHAPIAFIDGCYLLRDRGNLMIHFGFGEKQISSPVHWELKEGFLPCTVSSFTAGSLRVKVESFADKLTLHGRDYVAAYSRLTVTNAGDDLAVLPPVSPHLIALEPTPDILPPGETAEMTFVVGADRFGNKYPYPDADDFVQAGGFDAHYAHMRAYWLDRLSALAQLELPDASLVEAYKAGYIYMMIVKDGDCLHVGENGYDAVFDHDVIGITVSLLTMGDFRDFPQYASHILDNVQYPDARWKYSFPFAVYLLKTGDTDYVRRMLPQIRDNVHAVERDRDGTGLMRRTNAIDSLGHWTVDNWSALTGLWAYYYICNTLGEAAEAQWASDLYTDLLDAYTRALADLAAKTGIDYIPISMTETNEAGPRSDPRDANALSMCLFGRWAWDGFLFGAPQPDDLAQQIDRTYAHAREVRTDVGDSPFNFGGYPHGWYCSAYNAGYGSAALRGDAFRTLGIEAYRFMIANAMSGPYAWWEGVHPPADGSPWDRPHCPGGGGSCPHMWGQSVASKVLLDALIAEKADGTLLLCRGVPEDWLRAGKTIRVSNYPVSGGRVHLCVQGGERVRVELSGDVAGRLIDCALFSKIRIISANSEKETLVFWID